MSIHAFLNSEQLKDNLPTQRFVITLPESLKNTMNTRASSMKTSKRRGVALLIQGGAICPKLMQQPTSYHSSCLSLDPNQIKLLPECQA